METLTQVFFNKFCEYPKEALRSKEGQEMIDKIAKYIESKEGKESSDYFKNLMTVSEVI